MPFRLSVIFTEPKLSPACAAFDQFANFMERGKAFKKLVMALGE